MDAKFANTLRRIKKNGKSKKLCHGKKPISRESTTTKTQLNKSEQLQTRNKCVIKVLTVNELNCRLVNLQGIKPTTSSGAIEMSPPDPARSPIVKPMAGLNNQSATASIRSMSVQNSRTATVLSTNQTTKVASIHGNSSASSRSAVTALVLLQQVHSASGEMTDEVTSSTSSHTDYMPVTSKRHRDAETDSTDEINQPPIKRTRDQDNENILIIDLESDEEITSNESLDKEIEQVSTIRPQGKQNYYQFIQI